MNFTSTCCQPTWFFSGIAILLATAPAQAGQSNDFEVIQIVEEWEAEVGDPNELQNGPQVTMIMSPQGDLEGDYFSFLLNFRAEPSYAAGGMQVLHYSGDSVMAHCEGPSSTMLHHENETVHWRQTLSVNNGQLNFGVDQGTSESWGSFGGQGYLKQTVGTSLSNLNGYRPRLSLEASGIGFGGNRVESLRLMRLEWHLSDGRTIVYTAPIDIDSDLDPWDDPQPTEFGD